MVAPFKTRSLQQPNLVQRLFGWKAKKNSIVEISNLLADAARVTDVGPEHTEPIGMKYSTNISTTFSSERKVLYTDLLAHFLSDKHLSNDELSELSHLKHLLYLSDSEVGDIHETVTRAIYDEAVSEALEDGRLTTDERHFLERLENDLRLPETLAQSIYKERATDRINRCMNDALADQLLSPDEDTEIESIARSLGIALNHDDKTKRHLEQCRLYWQIQHGDMPEVPCDINIQKSERCYFLANADWHETRRVTRRINYGGPTLRIKIAKGLYWRTGSLGISRQSEDILQKLDTGRIYLTNKRLIYVGQQKNRNIRLNKILDFTVYKDGIGIEKDSGKSPILGFTNNLEVFAMLLGRAIRDLD